MQAMSRPWRLRMFSIKDMAKRLEIQVREDT
jgi:hypothetical protein